MPFLCKRVAIHLSKLPCNSGISIDRLESDSAIQQAIEALAALSVDSLDQIAWALSEQTERLSKVNAEPEPSLVLLNYFTS